MAYERLLSKRADELTINQFVATSFLTRHFDALQIKHPHYKNLVLLDGKTYWVIPTTEKHGITFWKHMPQEDTSLLDELRKLHAGILVLRQTVDNRLFIYQIERLEKMENYYKHRKILPWDEVDTCVSFIDSGIVVADELMGFRLLRNKLKAPVIPIRPAMLKIRA